MKAVMLYSVCTKVPYYQISAAHWAFATINVVSRCSIAVWVMSLAIFNVVVRADSCEKKFSQI